MDSEGFPLKAKGSDNTKRNLVIGLVVCTILLFIMKVVLTGDKPEVGAAASGTPVWDLPENEDRMERTFEFFLII